MINCNIEKLNPNNETEWEVFNKTYNGSFFHTLQWKKIMENNFNIKLLYCLLYSDDKVIGICPFNEGSLRGFRGLLSPQFSDYRQILLATENSQQIEDILKKISEFTKQYNVSFFMITTSSPKIKNILDNNKGLSYPIFGETGNLTLDLKENPPEKIWDKIFKKTSRQYIRRFEKDGFYTREVKSIQDVKEFYKSYKSNLEYKGRHPYAYPFFENLWNTLTLNEMRITLLCRNEVIRGGLLSFIYHPQKKIYFRHIAIDRNLENRYKVALYMYWESVIFASKMKFDSICFGETPLNPSDTTFKTKKEFGCSYEKIDSFIFPSSPIFKLCYNGYKYLNLSQRVKQRKKNHEK
jgi:hypothetical protein